MPNQHQQNGDYDVGFEDNYEVTPKWYQNEHTEPKNSSPVTEQTLIELKDEAKQCHDAEVANYKIKNSKRNADFRWMKTVMNSGTVTDRVAAHIVSIQDNPVCNLDTIRNLINTIKVGKKKECFTVMENLTELFLSDLLRPNQKLKPFSARPLSALTDMSSGNAITRRKILSHWYFEGELKEAFAEFVLALNRAAHDTVDSNKEKAVTAMFKLLSGNPEQEKNLLANIVNKLGDPSHKVASKAIYCLTQLLFKHPNMQEVVLKAVEHLMFRPNIRTKAQYYCLCFLSQFYLNHEDSKVAKKLVEVYISFFKACVKKGEVDSRMMSALLMGLNRAYPYAKLDFDDMSPHVETLFKLVHLTSFNIGLQVLMLLFHVTGDKMADRYYSALYRKLSDPKLLITTHQAMLLSLLYKSMLKDTQLQRVKVFIKRLLQISLYVQPSFACGLLYLISQLISKRRGLQALTLKEIKAESFADDDDGEEKYYDIKDEPVEEEVDRSNQTNNATPIESIEIKEDEDVKPDPTLLEISFKGSSWVHNTKSRIQSKYNPFSRNPLYAGGEFLAYTELRYLKEHFHPTVALWAQNIQMEEKVNYTGDPLKDFTLIRFLDRFVFKNPKNLEENAGAHPTFGKRKFYKPKGVKMLPVTSKRYLNEDMKNIPVDELFLYMYLQKKHQDKPLVDDKDEDSDMESVQSEEFEEMLDKMSAFKDSEMDEDIDYMGEIGDSLSKSDKKNKKRKSGEETDDDDELEGDDEELEDDEDFSDEESDLEGDDVDEDEPLEATEEDLELINDLSDDDDDDELEFPSDSEDEVEPKSKRSAFKKHTGKDLSSVFASAEEFASILEDEGSSKQKPGGSNVFDTRDNAGHKQLAWEDKRHRWIKGYNKAMSGKSNDKMSKKRPTSKKQQGKNKKVKRK